MRTPPMAIVSFVAAAMLGAVGQFMYKAGTDRAAGGLLGYLVNARILVGVACYIAVMVLFVAAFKAGGQPALLYPIYASTFIWAALLGLWLYGTPIRPVNVAGMVMLVGGMYLMGR
jgi:multidrug transporter EmrE-like cation transporter